MHRSGTSCLTRILNRAGLDLGNSLINSAVPDNLLGHWEDRSVISINDEILKESGGAWDQVPQQITTSAVVAAKMVEFVGRWNQTPVWGWKDPRTTLTFPAWRPHLPETRIVACVRHPYAVAKSLAVREEWPLERGLNLWLAYNRKLLDIVDHFPNVCWYQHGANIDDPALQIRSICAATGLEYSPDLRELINTHLDHHGTQVEIAEPEIREIYGRLTDSCQRQQQQAAERCEWSLAESSSNEIPGTSCNARSSSRIEELEAELKRLSEVVKASDVVIQHASWMARHLENACLGLQNQSAVIAQALGEQIAQTREQFSHSVVRDELAARQIAQLCDRTDQVPHALQSLHELIGSVQLQQDQLSQSLAQLGQSLAQQERSLQRFSNILPFRIYRWLGERVKSILKRSPACGTAGIPAGTATTSRPASEARRAA